MDNLKPSDVEVAILIRDLIFETKIKSTAQSLGIEAKVVRSVSELERLWNEHAIRLLIVDLNTAQNEACEAIRTAKARPGVRAIAFVSHVDVELARLAAVAGADEILPRSRFTAQLPELLARKPQRE